MGKLENFFTNQSGEWRSVRKDGRIGGLGNHRQEDDTIGWVKG
jgi:hypothetical protein